MARRGGQSAAVARTIARPDRKPSASLAAPEIAQPNPPIAPVVATPAFHERSLFAEGLAAAFRIDAGGAWATGTKPYGAGENEIAKFLCEAMSLAKQMQSAMGGADAASVQILIADPEAVTRQSAIKVAVESSGGTTVALQSGAGGHMVAMLQHFLMALNPASRDAA